jgi:hypothetical protein
MVCLCCSLLWKNVDQVNSLNKYLGNRFIAVPKVPSQNKEKKFGKFSLIQCVGKLKRHGAQSTLQSNAK